VAKWDEASTESQMSLASLHAFRADLDRFRQGREPATPDEAPDLRILAEMLAEATGRRGKGRPPRAYDAARNTVELAVVAGRPHPVRFIFDASSACRMVERERYVLALKREFAWVLKWLGADLPLHLATETAIRRYLRPLQWSDSWSFPRYLARRRQSKQSWSDLATLWIYEIAKGRAGRLRDAERFVDGLEKHARRTRSDA
jgi:hypothetical protein